MREEHIGNRVHKSQLSLLSKKNSTTMIRESLNIKNMNPQGIVRKGYLIKSPAAAKSKIKSKLRKWTRKWFVLYDIDMIKDGTHLQEDDEPPSLYYYDSKEHFEANKQPRGK